MNKFLDYKTEGIILRKSDFGEHDWILNIYTKDFGKIETVARGARKISAKLKGHLELFNYVAIDFIQGKNFKTLTGAETLRNFKNSRLSLEKSLAIQRIVALADQLIIEPEKDEKIWRLILQTLNEFDVPKPEVKLLFYYFKFKILCLLGYAPELYNCAECEKRLVPADNFFSPSEGGILCEKCHAGRGIKTNPETIKILRLFESQDRAYIKRLKISADDQAALKNCLDYFMEYHLGDI